MRQESPETLDAMQENKDSIFDNPFRLGSEMFFQTIHEARRLHLEGKYRPTAVDKNLLKTDLGEFAEFDGHVHRTLQTLLNLSLKGSYLLQ